MTSGYVPQVWHDLPEMDTPISAQRLTHIENGVYDAASALAAVMGAGATGKSLLAAGTPEQARGIIGAAGASDVTGKVTNVSAVTGIMWSPTLPTAQSLTAQAVPSGTLVASQAGFSYWAGGLLIPIGASWSNPEGSAAFAGRGTLAATARVATAARTAPLTGTGVLSASSLTPGTIAAAAPFAGSGTLSATGSAGTTPGFYDDFYSDLYGS